MDGVSKISSEQGVMLVSFTDANPQTMPLSATLMTCAKHHVVVDMICQSAPRGNAIDYSFTASYTAFDAVLQAISGYKASPPLISSGYTKLNLFGEEMAHTCGVAANALDALCKAHVDVYMITTSDLDISLLVRAEDEDMALAVLQQTFGL